MSVEAIFELVKENLSLSQIIIIIGLVYLTKLLDLGIKEAWKFFFSDKAPYEHDVETCKKLLELFDDDVLYIIEEWDLGGPTRREYLNKIQNIAVEFSKPSNTLNDKKIDTQRENVAQTAKTLNSNFFHLNAFGPDLGLAKLVLNREYTKKDHEFIQKMNTDATQLFQEYSKFVKLVNKRTSKKI